MHRSAPLFLITTQVVAIPTVASSAPGLPLTVAGLGVIWRARKAARLETAAAARATIPRIGTTRESQWIQTPPTAFSLTRSISGLQRPPELSGMIPAVVIPERVHILCTWT